LLCPIAVHPDALTYVCTDLVQSFVETIYYINFRRLLVYLLLSKAELPAPGRSRSTIYICTPYGLISIYIFDNYYLRRRLDSEGIVTLGVTLSRRVCIRRISLGGEGNALYPVLSRYYYYYYYYFTPIEAYLSQISFTYTYDSGTHDSGT